MSDDTVVNLDFDKLPGGHQASGGLVLGNLTGEDWYNLFNLGERIEFLQGDVILEQNQLYDSLCFVPTAACASNAPMRAKRNCWPNLVSPPFSAKCHFLRNPKSASA